MPFNLDLAIQIASHLQNQDRTRALIGPEDIPHEKDNEEPWRMGETLQTQLLLMQDAGWLADVEIFNAAGQWQARLTYHGNLWLDASRNESLMKRIRQELQSQGIRAAHTVVAETIKGIVATVT